MTPEEKKARQREYTKRWRERNPDKVKAANIKKRVRVYDPEKRAAWRAAYIANAPGVVDKINAQARRRKEEVNAFLREHKLKAGCKSCGYSEHHAALEFHHVGAKEINLSFAKSLGMAKREMEKCVVLCANCHRIHHWNETHEATYEKVED